MSTSSLHHNPSYRLSCSCSSSSGTPCRTLTPMTWLHVQLRVGCRQACHMSDQTRPGVRGHDAPTHLKKALLKRGWSAALRCSAACGSAQLLAKGWKPSRARESFSGSPVRLQHCQNCVMLSRSAHVHTVIETDPAILLTQDWVTADHHTGLTAERHIPRCVCLSCKCSGRDNSMPDALLSAVGRRPSGGYTFELRRPAVKGTAGPPTSSKLRAPAS